MLLKIKENFYSMVNELFNSKLETLKANLRLIEIDNFIEYYKKNKNEFFSRKENIEKIFSEYFSNIDLDFSLPKNFDNEYIDELIETLEDIYQNSLHSIRENIKIKTIEKFKKIINFIGLLYINNVDIVLNYGSVSIKTKIERAPPLSYLN